MRYGPPVARKDVGLYPVHDVLRTLRRVYRIGRDGRECRFNVCHSKTAGISRGISIPFCSRACSEPG